MIVENDISALQPAVSAEGPSRDAEHPLRVVSATLEMAEQQERPYEAFAWNRSVRNPAVEVVHACEQLG